ncbi:uncharacterized protein LOC112341632 [Selaginella moellendorffii]|uniref:uncharacterized protein LOC112341632 n=1 Tax=Selaginella moellendorffii TaxID=88036 RepID=UPI000D1C64FD|nr:uncharacterized protein LOC112341632 [Selaginella moellendorffii]|eukprot:XP_024517902.1 uncharacterized protein LOC112341632 [Selaginella moellendorffii]
MAASSLLQAQFSPASSSLDACQVSYGSSAIISISRVSVRQCWARRSQRVFCVATKIEELEPVIPTSAEIHTLLREVCDETKIAELNVKVGAFNLHMRRSVPAPKPPPAASVAAPPVAAPAAAPVSSKPAAPSKPAAKTSKVSPMMSKAVAYDELQKAAAETGVVFVNAPKVGLFRRSRLVKGKFGAPLCQEGQTVKEGQVVCYLEQFGTQTAVESETSGDVIKVLWEDGVPVGYGDPLIALKPKK